MHDAGVDDAAVYEAALHDAEESSSAVVVVYETAVYEAAEYDAAAYEATVHDAAESSSAVVVVYDTAVYKAAAVHFRAVHEAAAHIHTFRRNDATVNDAAVFAVEMYDAAVNDLAQCTSSHE